MKNIVLSVIVFLILFLILLALYFLCAILNVIMVQIKNPSKSINNEKHQIVMKFPFRVPLVMYFIYTARKKSANLS